MQRRLIALLLVLLLLPGLSMLAQDDAKAQTVAQLNKLVEDMINSNGYTYTFEDDTFTIEFNLEGALSNCSVEVRVYYDAVEVIATPSIRVPEANRVNAALYTTLANYELFYSQFGMRLETGTFYTRAVQLVETVLPGVDELFYLVHMPVNGLESYGDGFAQVALMGADPYETMEKVLEANE